MSRIMIGTRGSALALWQAKHVRATLEAEHESLQVELKIIKTKGDRLLKAPLHALGDKGLFTKEIEAELLAGTIDLAVHSLKDLPTDLPDGLALGAITAREDPSDALVAKDGATLESLPVGATVLTGSLRRGAQLLHFRSDLDIAPVRGNVQTRLRKLDESDAHAIVLASAGLVRLELADRISQRLDPARFLPACGQGALGIEIRADNDSARQILTPLNDIQSRSAVTAERAFLAALGGGCQVPIGAYGRIEGDRATLRLTGMVASLDGARLLADSVEAAFEGVERAELLGRELAEKLLAAGCREILDEVSNSSPPSSESNL